MKRDCTDVGGRPAGLGLRFSKLAPAMPTSHFRPDATTVWVVCAAVCGRQSRISLLSNKSPGICSYRLSWQGNYYFFPLSDCEERRGRAVAPLQR
jgi:hypothetical protein